MVPASVQEYAGTQQVTVVPTISSDRDLFGNASGLVTADWSGNGLTSGKGAYQVNDRTVVALNTATPLYRDLKTGDIGGDVLALNNELSLLGYNSVPGSDTYWRATSDGWKQLMADNGNTSDGSLSLADTLWIPEHEVAVDEWSATAGSMVTGRHRNRQNPRIIDETHHQKRHRIRAGPHVDDIRHYGNIASQYY